MTTSPIVMTLIVMVQALSLCLYTSSFMLDSLLTLIVILVYVGGVLVVFTYLCSVSYNELVSWDFNMSFWLLCPSFILLCTSALTGVGALWASQESSMSLYQESFIMAMLVLITFLFITMVMSTLISSMFKGKLRQK